MKILVCYLVAPGEVYAKCAHEFIESYWYHEAGMEHTLLPIIKTGAEIPGGSWPNPLIERHPNTGWDIWSLQRVALDHEDYDYIVWFGSWSRILSNDWLTKLYGVVRQPTVGMVGATGSFESGVSGLRPNAHLRTTALMFAPGTLNSLPRFSVDTQRDAYEFEHGQDSVYRQLQRRDLAALVVGADGMGYPEERWAESRTFRRGEQENLLIADKQTDAYMAASSSKRFELALMAGWMP